MYTWLSQWCHYPATWHFILLLSKWWSLYPSASECLSFYPFGICLLATVSLVIPQLLVFYPSVIYLLASVSLSFFRSCLSCILRHPLVLLTPAANLPPVSTRRWQIRNDPNVIIRGLGEGDSWKKPEAKNLVTLSFFKSLLFLVQTKLLAWKPGSEIQSFPSLNQKVVLFTKVRDSDHHPQVDSEQQDQEVHPQDQNVCRGSGKVLLFLHRHFLTDIAFLQYVPFFRSQSM
jgi:hypothetical protein